jgi:hypothetical protein
LQKGIKKQCYVCGRDVFIDVRFKDFPVHVCTGCEADKNMFLLNLFKKTRDGLVARKEAEKATNDETKQSE